MAASDDRPPPSWLWVGVRTHPPRRRQCELRCRSERLTPAKPVERRPDSLPRLKAWHAAVSGGLGCIVQPCAQCPGGTESHFGQRGKRGMCLLLACSRPSSVGSGAGDGSGGPAAACGGTPQPPPPPPPPSSSGRAMAGSGCGGAGWAARTNPSSSATPAGRQKDPKGQLWHDAALSNEMPPKEFHCIAESTADCRAGAA